MYLFEFESDQGLTTKILIASDKLEDLRQQGKLKDNWHKEELYRFFADFGIPKSVIDKNIFNMIQKDPLKKTISNVQGDKVIFKGNKGEEAPDAPPPEQSKKVVDQMAKKAMKK